MNYFNNGIMKEIYFIMQSARVDIKNFGGKENDVIIDFSSDLDMYGEIPQWWKDDYGTGKVIQSAKGEITLRFHVIGNGKLVIKFMGPYLKEMNYRSCFKN